MRSEPSSALLDRVRKLLAKAEAEGVTPPEAEALTAKAAELMAATASTGQAGRDPAGQRTGRAAGSSTLTTRGTGPGPPAGRAGRAMRCQCVLLSTARPGARIHIFGYASDLERVDILYTSLLLQMAHGLTTTVVPVGVRSPGPGGGAGCSASSRPSTRARRWNRTRICCPRSTCCC